VQKGLRVRKGQQGGAERTEPISLSAAQEQAAAVGAAWSAAEFRLSVSKHLGCAETQRWHKSPSEACELFSWETWAQGWGRCSEWHQMTSSSPCQPHNTKGWQGTAISHRVGKRAHQDFCMPSEGTLYTHSLTPDPVAQLGGTEGHGCCTPPVAIPNSATTGRTTVKECSNPIGCTVVLLAAWAFLPMLPTCRKGIVTLPISSGVQHRARKAAIAHLLEEPWLSQCSPRQPL